MGKFTKIEIEKMYDRWLEMLYRPEFREMKRPEQAKIIGVSLPTITRWKQNLSPNKWAQILKISREVTAEPSVEIDTALYRKAKSGDVTAIKLWYERIEQWSPKQNLEVTRGIDKELTPEQMEVALKDALALLPEDKRGQFLSSFSLPQPQKVVDVPSEPLKEPE